MKPHIRFARPPRVISTVEGLAAYLDHSTAWLHARLDRWERLGFPKRDDELDGWDIEAVDLWIDGRSKLLSRSDQVRADRAALGREFGLGDIEDQIPGKTAA